MGVEITSRYYIVVGPEDKEHVRESAEGKAPHLDYRELADLVDGIVIEGAPPPAKFRASKPLAVLRSMIPNLIMAFRLVRQVASGSVILSTGETWGLPLGLAIRMASRKGIRHYVYVHRVFTPNWRHFLRTFGVRLDVDGWFCLTNKQKRALREVLGEQALIDVIIQGVDTRFFNPKLASDAFAALPPYILAVGAEMRDYALLFEAVSGLRLPVMIRASSKWTTGQRQRIAEAPPNVKLIERQLSYGELRDLYAGAAVVVVPLVNTLQAAGINTILEAMAMHRPVIATRSDGLPDILVNGETGLVVDAKASDLAAAIQDTILAGKKCKRILDRASTRVEEEASLERFAARIAAATCAKRDA